MSGIVIGLKGVGGDMEEFQGGLSPQSGCLRGVFLCGISRCVETQEGSTS